MGLWACEEWMKGMRPSLGVGGLLRLGCHPHFQDRRSSGGNEAWRGEGVRPVMIMCRSEDGEVISGIQGG